MNEPFDSSAAAREFITLPTLQDKELFFRTLEPQHRVVLVKWLKAYSEQDHSSTEAKAAFSWLYEISAALSNSGENDLKTLIKNGLDSGFLQSPDKLVEVFTSSASQALES